MSDLAEFLAASNLLPHGHCLFWRPDLLLLHVISDALIALAYFTIPLALLELIRRRKDLVFNHVFLLFACFITACGLTHVFNLADIWLALYPYSGIMKAITAVISLATAITVWRLLPDAVSLPSHQQLQERNIEIARINGQLREEIQTRKQAEQKLSEYANTLNTTNEELKDFVYIASHDLQEPLRLITSYLNVIKEDYGDKFDDDGQRFIDYTLDSSGRLQQLVTDLLGYSRLTTDQKPMAEYDSREIVQTALDDLTVAIEEAGANVHLTNTLPTPCLDSFAMTYSYAWYSSTLLATPSSTPKQTSQQKLRSLRYKMKTKPSSRSKTMALDLKQDNTTASFKCSEGYTLGINIAAQV